MPSIETQDLLIVLLAKYKLLKSTRLATGEPIWLLKEESISLGMGSGSGELSKLMLSEWAYGGWGVKSLIN